MWMWRHPNERKASILRQHGVLRREEGGEKKSSFVANCSWSASGENLYLFLKHKCTTGKNTKNHKSFSTFQKTERENFHSLYTHCTQFNGGEWIGRNTLKFFYCCVWINDEWMILIVESCMLLLFWKLSLENLVCIKVVESKGILKKCKICFKIKLFKPEKSLTQQTQQNKLKLYLIASQHNFQAEKARQIKSSC
mgnify:CR=1 FL=1